MIFEPTKLSSNAQHHRIIPKIVQRGDWISKLDKFMSKRKRYQFKENLEYHHRLNKDNVNEDVHEQHPESWDLFSTVPFRQHKPRNEQLSTSWSWKWSKHNSPSQHHFPYKKYLKNGKVFIKVNQQDSSIYLPKMGIPQCRSTLFLIYLRIYSKIVLVNEQS